MIKSATLHEVAVRDVMTRDVTTIPASATIAEARRILHERRISGAPVLSASGRVVGVVSASDLIDPRHEGPVTDPVDAVMTRVVFAVKASDPVILAARLMVEERIHRVVVVGEGGALVGIVTPMDLVRHAVPEGEAREALGFEYVDLRRDESDQSPRGSASAKR